MEIFYPNGALHRALACQTTEAGQGLRVGAIWVDEQINLRGLGLNHVRQKLSQLIAAHPAWLVSAPRPARPSKP